MNAETIERALRPLIHTSRLPEAARPEAARAILLDLAAETLRGRRVSVTDACIASLHPPTTALRHIGELAGAGLIERQDDERDKRRVFLALTRAGREALAYYLETLA